MFSLAYFAVCFMKLECYICILNVYVLLYYTFILLFKHNLKYDLFYTNKSLVLFTKLLLLFFFYKEHLQKQLRITIQLL